MNDNDENKGTSAGRARGYSMWSTLRATTQEQNAGAEHVANHAGISFARLREHSDQDISPGRAVQRPSVGSGRIVSESRVSLLTTAIQAAGESIRIGISTQSLRWLLGTSVSASKPIDIEQPAVKLVRDFSNMSSSTDEGTSESEEEIPDPLDQGEKALRKWCTGQPPKKSFLGSGGRLSARLPFARRSTLADKPELDVTLALTKTAYNGHLYLPLTARTIHRLSPYWKGEKPIADTKLFDCMMITHEINGVHADHVVAALQRIGTHCKHLLVVSPVQTSELGNVFNREAGNITAGNDWDCILACFPSLRYLAFIHPINEPVELSRGTLSALHMAVAKRQAAQQLKRFEYDGPVQLITDLHHDMASAYSKNTV
jgi:hypothetical protein